MLERINEHVFSEITSTLYLKHGKRIVDIMVSLFLVILLFPVLVILACFIFFQSGTPIIFRQIRGGQGNKPFIIWKFRTLKDSGNKVKSHAYNWKEAVPENFTFKMPAHLSFTKTGKLFRKYSLDELPQLWNVLKGEMSLVGPRPEIIEITSYYSPMQKQRLLVRPGITGYAQVNGRSAITHGEKISYDLYYVQNCSFLLDLKIIFQTFLIVFTGKDAT